MKDSLAKNGFTRRDAMKLFTTGSTAGLFGLLGGRLNAQDAASRVAAVAAGTTTNAPAIPDVNKGSAPITIRKVKAVATAPEGANLVVVKGRLRSLVRMVGAAPPTPNTPKRWSRSSMIT